MPINPPLTQPQNTYTLLDIIQDALIEVGMLAPGEPVTGEIGPWAFRKANYLLDEWAANNVFVYAVTFGIFQLVPNLSPHTIGPSNATFSVNQRPVQIESAAVLLPGTGGNNVDVDIAIEDEDWWSANPVKNLASSLPTHLYYSPDNPNGSLYYWPAPTIAYQTRLRFWTLLSQFSAIDDPIDGPGGIGILPPAYRHAIMLSLAEQLGGQPPESLPQRAMKARAALLGNNQLPPRISTKDGGMPTPAHGRPRYNFLTREPY